MKRLITLTPWVDRVLCLSSEPQIESGERVFRPNQNTLRYELIRWSFGQVVAFVFLVIVLLSPTLLQVIDWPDWLWPVTLVLQWSTWVDRLTLEFLPDYLHGMVLAFALTAFFTQLFATLSAIWLRYRYTWLIVGEEAVRLRTGWASLREITMRYTVIQQVRLQQGPLQRWCGVGDVEMRSAAGRNNDEDSEQQSLVKVRHFDQPAELRDLVRTHAELLRHAIKPQPTPTPAPDLLVAARGVLSEAQALRHSLEHFQNYNGLNKKPLE